MASSWRRTLGNVRSFVSNSMGGVRGGSNLASWIVAGSLAYFLWIKPFQDLKRQQEEKAALAASDPYKYVEKRKPIPDPQVLDISSSPVFGTLTMFFVAFSIFLARIEMGPINGEESED